MTISSNSSRTYTNYPLPNTSRRNGRRNGNDDGTSEGTEERSNGVHRCYLSRRPTTSSNDKASDTKAYSMFSPRFESPNSSSSSWLSLQDDNLPDSNACGRSDEIVLFPPSEVFADRDNSKRDMLLPSKYRYFGVGDDDDKHDHEDRQEISGYSTSNEDDDWDEEVETLLASPPSKRRRLSSMWDNRSIFLDRSSDYHFITTAPIKLKQSSSLKRRNRDNTHGINNNKQLLVLPFRPSSDRRGPTGERRKVLLPPPQPDLFFPSISLHQEGSSIASSGSSSSSNSSFMEVQSSVESSCEGSYFGGRYTLGASPSFSNLSMAFMRGHDRMDGKMMKKNNKNNINSSSNSNSNSDGHNEGALSIKFKYNTPSQDQRKQREICASTLKSKDMKGIYTKNAYIESYIQGPPPLRRRSYSLGANF